MMGAVAVMVNHVMDLSAGDGQPAGEVKGESDVSEFFITKVSQNDCVLLDAP
jgi:hypothetical protein